MPLSEYEQHLLDEIEHELADGSARPGQWAARTGRPVLRGLGGAVGLLLVIAGLRITAGVGVFVAVTASAVAAVRERRRRGRPEATDG